MEIMTRVGGVVNKRRHFHFCLRRPHNLHFSSLLIQHHGRKHAESAHELFNRPALAADANAIRLSASAAICENSAAALARNERR
jgi:hypothetical protein